MFPVPQEDEKHPGVRKSVPWMLAWLGAQPSGWQAQEGLPTAVGPTQRGDGRKPCKTGFPHHQPAIFLVPIT